MISKLLRIPAWLQLLLLCLVVVPVLAYLTGNLVLGPYPGGFGLLGYVGRLYADALRVEPAAWILLSAPALIIGLWKVALQVSRAAPAASGKPE